MGHARVTPHAPSGESKAEFCKTVAGPLLGVVIGGLISAATTWGAAQLTADNQRKQFLVEHVQSFAEVFVALNLHPEKVPQECQSRLEECRRDQINAVEMYLILPTAAQEELVKALGGQHAREVTASGCGNYSTPEKVALCTAFLELRKWVHNSNKVESDFNFILPCADWKIEEKECRKP